MPDLNCPKCRYPMENRNFGPAVTVARCTRCHGIWCALADIDDLDQLPMLDVLDIGDAKRGQLYDQVRNIQCPECDQPMVEQTIPRQTHIAIELCENCSKVFLDAGELRDAAHHTLGEWLRSWLPNLKASR